MLDQFEIRAEDMLTEMQSLLRTSPLGYLEVTTSKSKSRHLGHLLR